MGCAASTAQPDVADQRNEAAQEPVRPSSSGPHSVHGGGEDRSEESSTNGNESNAVSTREGHLTDKDKMNLRGLSGAMSESAGYGAQQFKRGVTHLLGADSLEGPAALKSDLEAFFKPLMKDHAKFLFNFVLTFHTNPSNAHAKEGATDMSCSKPKLEARQFKSHTMDNVRVRKMCDELLQLEDPTHMMADETARSKPWMRTLQVSRGKYINAIKMNNNPDVTIGGYFIISQMLGYIRGLVSLDLCCNELKGAEARVLALGLKCNRSIQDLHLKENSIGTEGATSMAEALKENNTLLFLDLRQNNIRGPGVCVLTDAMNNNKTLTQLDLRWNYTGESSDYVEQALLDLQRFCGRNLVSALHRNRAAETMRSSRVSDASTAEVVNEDSSANESARGTHGVIVPGTEARQLEIPDGFNKIGPMLGKDDLTGTPLSSESGSDEHQPVIGKLEVTIISAKNLPQVIWTSGKDGEFLGLPQAYCVFQCNQQMEKTGINKKDWNPKWNHSLIVDVKNVWNIAQVHVKHGKNLSKIDQKDDSMIATMSVPVGAVMNWRGVSKSVDGTWRAYHRPTNAGRGAVYHVCKGMDREGQETDVFDTAELAAKAYDDMATKKDLDKAVLNFAMGPFSGNNEAGMVGYHVKEEHFPLSGEDGVEVIGVQAGVSSSLRLRLKYFDLNTNYLEIHLNKATSLPKMDAGLGTCDAYCVLIWGDYQFRSRVVRNSLDPPFAQTFRVAIPNDFVEAELRVQIWDWDRFDDDDHMGDATVMMTKDAIEGGTINGGYGVVAAIEGDGTSVQYLTNAKGDKSIIHLSFSYFPLGGMSMSDSVSTRAASQANTPATPLFI